MSSVRSSSSSSRRASGTRTQATSGRAGLTAGAKPEARLAANHSRVKKDELESALPVSRKDLKRREAEQRQASARARKALHQVVHKLEKEIQDLESRQAELIAELEQQDTYLKPGRAQEVNRELISVQHRLAELNPEWEQAAAHPSSLRVAP